MLSAHHKFTSAHHHTVDLMVILVNFHANFANIICNFRNFTFKMLTVTLHRREILIISLRILVPH